MTIDWTRYGFPENCPPSDAREHQGTIYSFVKNTPPVSEDFRTAHEKGLHLNGNPCERRAISCGKTIDYLENIKKFFPATKGWKKAAGEITYDDGFIKQTGSQPLHHSFWISPEQRDNFNEKFKVIEL